ncbi:MAG TPA: ATP-binding protein [Leptolyngbyaceae cyanobacterium]
MNQALHVLLIDDNRSDRALVLRELRREFTQLEAIEVIDADTLEQALASDGFDIVITDYQLHWSDGLTVLRIIKARYPQCPVLMFTNTGTEEIAVEALQSGLDDYILKAPNRYVRLPASIRLALQRKQDQRRAALLEIRLQELLTQLRVGVFRAKPDGTLLESNPAFLEILGVDSLEQASAMALLDIGRCYELHKPLLQPEKLEQEMQICRPNGTQFWGLLTATINTIGAEQVIDGLLENITERKQAEIMLQQLNTMLEERVSARTEELKSANQTLDATNQELKNLTAQLEVANQDLKEFTYIVSHDLRAPLRIIQGFSQFLIEDEQLSPKGLEDAQIIASQAQQADTLIRQLLDYSRLGKTQISIEPTSLSSVLAHVLEKIRLFMQEQNACIQVKEPLPVVAANSLILEQILSNLLTNAVKFTRPSTQSEVRIWAEKFDDSARLWIEDNGIGIEEEQQQEIFKPFTRLHSVDQYPGSGIGLAIVRKSVDLLGGAVGVYSSKEWGSRFWIELPVTVGKP